MIRENFYGFDPDTNYKIVIIKDDNFVINIAELGEIKKTRYTEICEYLQNKFGNKYIFHSGSNYIELKYNNKKSIWRHTNSDAFVIEWHYDKKKDNSTLSDIDICRLIGIPQMTFVQWKKRESRDWRYVLYNMLKNMSENEICSSIEKYEKINTNKKIVERINEALNSFDSKAFAFANNSALNSQDIYEILSGKKDLDTKTLQICAKELRCDLDWLFTGAISIEREMKIHFSDYFQLPAAFLGTVAESIMLVENIYGNLTRTQIVSSISYLYKFKEEFLKNQYKGSAQEKFETYKTLIIEHLNLPNFNAQSLT